MRTALLFCVALHGCREKNDAEYNNDDASGNSRDAERTDAKSSAVMRKEGNEVAIKRKEKEERLNGSRVSHEHKSESKEDACKSA